MSHPTIYRTEYTQSRALIIGINRYTIAPPLDFARQDAEAISDLLRSEFAFPQANITTLLDEAATTDAIRAAFLNFANPPVSPDDRIVVFFAGHGFTHRGHHRGEVGYLVPVHGNSADLSTLMRWDDLTRNADLIPAKHIFFIMDACYSGLALTRAGGSGGSRFVSDMKQRFARQVLTAGKGDETVSDGGGPRPGHSIFTGHLLDALEGAAASDDVISANAVMSYVYQRVANDQYSKQTPHYGFIDGDGDLIFAEPTVVGTGDAGEGRDILVTIPDAPRAPELEAKETPLSNEIKEYLSDPKYRIRLADVVAREIRAASYGLRDERFPLKGPATQEEFIRRVSDYAEAISRLTVVAVLIAHWGEAEHRSILEQIIARVSDTLPASGGDHLWLSLRWYPILRLVYAAGVSATAKGNYDNLATVLRAPVVQRAHDPTTRAVIVPVVENILELDRAEMFKRIPGQERHYVPRSEFLFTSLQPEIDDLLFLGRSYENAFDRFEILYALTYADLTLHGEPWGPVGRFAWKQKHDFPPFDALLQEAQAEGSSWPILKAGFFSGEMHRFDAVARPYRDRVLKALPWF